MQRHAGDDPAEQILSGEPENDRSGPRGRQQSCQPLVSAITVPQHDQQRDQVDKKRDNLPGKMRDGRLLFLFEIEIPDVTIDQRDDEGGAQEDERSSNVIAQIESDAIRPQRGVSSERQTKKPIQNAEANAGAPLQKSAHGQRNKKCADKCNQGGGSSLRIKRKGRHRLVGRIILSRPRPDKRCSYRPSRRCRSHPVAAATLVPRRAKLAYSRFRFAISSRRRMISLRRSSFLRFT